MSERAINPLVALAAAVFLLASQSSCQPNHDTPMNTEIIRIAFDTPSAGWIAKPLEAWETDEAIICIFQLSPPEGMAAQVITKIESTMRIPASAKPKRLVAIGKTWNWTPGGKIEFPKDIQLFQSSLSAIANRIEIQETDAPER